jgi:microcin C transport system permease protein
MFILEKIMLNYFIRRFLLIIPTFLGCTIIVFTILQLTPGGPLEMALLKYRSQATGEAGGGGGTGGKEGVEIPPEARAQLERYFDLDKPITVRYFKWLGKLAVGDFGDSYIYGEPAADVIISRFPVSIYFGLVGFFGAYLVCIPLGIFKAIRHGSAFDLTSSTLVFIGYSIPGFVLGALLIVVLGRKLGWLPTGGFESEAFQDMAFGEQVIDRLKHTALPVISYMVGSFATLTILMKNSLLDNLGQDYVRTAFAKGLSEKRVVFVHALRNSMIPIATGLGHALSLVLAGSFLIERTFDIQGMGLLGYKSAIGRDYTIVMGILVISVVLQLVGNILSDFLYSVFDPRIRFR